MTIPPGTRLGPFDVLDLLGAGGMGAVYRAYDPRLRRHVAIKVLPEAFARDRERVQRFEREALAVARLTHPNILALHDVGAHDGAPYIVTELLEGRPLRTALQDGALPVPRAVEIAIQVARGLAAAHECGIVHRDIKPDNLFLVRGGAVKILDFGIARLTDVEAGAETAAVTQTMQGLGPIGTAAYMSPEQARGAQADRRADLFSLGVVLYEMLTGISPFQRPTAAETMTAVLREDPLKLPAVAECPSALVRVLQHCLEKDAADRFQTARDLAFALEGTDMAGTAVAPAPPRAVHAAVAWFTAGGLMLGAAAGFVLARRPAAPPAPTSVSAVHRLTDFSGLEEFPAMSPDFKSVAFTAYVNGTRQIFVRLLAGGTPLQITTAAVDHELPRWSRDSSSIVYFSPAEPGRLQGTLWEVPALGGAPRRLLDSIGGADVAPDERLATFRLGEAAVELVTTSPEGSDVREVAQFTEAVYYKYPRWSPDGRWIAFQRGDGVRWDVFAVQASGGKPRQLTHDNTQIHGLAWLPDSTGIVYSSSRGTSMPYLPTVGLWETALRGGEPRRVVATDVSLLYPDVHPTGAILATRLQMDFDLWRYGMNGTPLENVRGAERLTTQTGQLQTPTVGASDREIAFLSDSGGHANVWVLTPETGELRQITYERDPDVALGVPIWSPDGESIGLVSSRGNRGLGFGVWLVQPDGGNLRNLVARGLGMTWSPDGQWIYYADNGVAYKVPAAGGPASQVRSGPTRNVAGFDGTTLYFTVDRTLTDRSRGFEIHAATPEDGSSRVLAEIDAGRAPQWQIVNPALSPDGAWLAMPLTDGVTTNVWTLSTATGVWRQITDFGDRPTFIARRVSWSADGRSILAAVGEGDADIVLLEAHSSPP